MVRSRIPANPKEWLGRLAGGAGLVFADIIGSTRLVHDHGTRLYGRILVAYRSRARQLAGQHDGWIISREGDQVFAAFPNATRAYAFGRGLFDNAGHELLAVRIGMHFGAVRLLRAEVIGRSVPFAQRVMAHGAAHEFWVSDAAKTRLDTESGALPAAIEWLTTEECVLKGVPDRQRLWRAG